MHTVGEVKVVPSVSRVQGPTCPAVAVSLAEEVARAHQSNSRRNVGGRQVARIRNPHAHSDEVSHAVCGS
jgi:hypothetical protein